MENSYYLQQLSLAAVQISSNSLYWCDRQCKLCQKRERKGSLYGPLRNSNGPLVSKELSHIHFTGHKLTTRDIPFFCFSESSEQTSRSLKIKLRTDLNQMSSSSWNEKSLVRFSGYLCCLIPVWIRSQKPKKQRQIASGLIKSPRRLTAVARLLAWFLQMEQVNQAPSTQKFGLKSSLSALMMNFIFISEI